MRVKVKKHIKTITCNAALAINLSSFMSGQGSYGLGIEARRNDHLQILLASAASNASKFNARSEQLIQNAAAAHQGTIRQDAQMLLAGGCAASKWISTCLAGGAARAELSLSTPTEFYRVSGKWIPVVRVGTSAPLLRLHDQGVTVSLDASRFWVKRGGGTLEWQKQSVRKKDSARADLSLTGGNNSAVAAPTQELPVGFPAPGNLLDGLTAVGLSVSVRID